MGDPWRMRCPRGHASISDSRGVDGSYRCPACGRRWSHGPYDAAAVEFPVVDPDEQLPNSKYGNQLLAADPDTI